MAHPLAELVCLRIICQCNAPTNLCDAQRQNIQNFTPCYLCCLCFIQFALVLLSNCVHTRGNFRGTNDRHDRNAVGNHPFGHDFSYSFGMASVLATLLFDHECSVCAEDNVPLIVQTLTALCVSFCTGSAIAALGFSRSKEFTETNSEQR